MKRIDDLKIKLKAQTIFTQLNDLELQQLCDSASIESFKKGQFLIHEGMQNHCLHLIVEGQVDVRSYGISIAKLGQGSLLGEVSVAGLSAATADVIAISKAKTICLPFKSILELEKSKPSFAAMLHDTAMSRLLS